MEQSPPFEARSQPLRAKLKARHPRIVKVDRICHIQNARNLAKGPGIFGHPYQMSDNNIDGSSLDVLCQRPGQFAGLVKPGLQGLSAEEPLHHIARVSGLRNVKQLGVQPA